MKLFRLQFRSVRRTARPAGFLSLLTIAPLIAPMIALAVLRPPLSMAQSDAAPAATGPAVSATSATVAVPKLIRFSGTLIDGRGWPITVPVQVSFAVYSQPSGEEQPALWKEAQLVSPNSKGAYTVLLGAATSNGVPVEIFKAGESQYLGVRTEGEPEQTRVLMVSVPYALKAGDAATLGGLPASAYALAGSKTAAANPPALGPNLTSNVTTTGGTSGYVPEFTGASTIADSPIFVSGTDVGVGTATPTATLDVTGSGLFTGGLTVDGVLTQNGFLLLPALGTATTATSYNSQYFKLVTSAYNSSTKTIVAPRFQLQAEVKGNNTANPIGTLNLIASNGPGSPTETGFSIQSNGIVNFAPGQTFPGGSGTITGVTAGTALTGGGTTGNVTLNVDTTKIPLLAASNTFTGNQSVTGSESVSGSITSGASLFLPNTASSTVGVVALGGTPFLSNYGPANSSNVFVGGAGNFTLTGGGNTAVGSIALHSTTTGSFDTALGSGGALYSNTTGSYDTAIGISTLVTNTTGSNNTAVGGVVMNGNTTGSNNTAVGAFALVGSSTGDDNTSVGSYAMFGNTTGSYNAAFGQNTLVGNTTGSANTAVGSGAMFSNATGSNNAAFGDNAMSNNTTGGSNTSIGDTAMYHNTTGSYNDVLGGSALASNTTGSNNDALGDSALYSNTAGIQNTAVGNAALFSNTTGTYSAAFGEGALYHSTTGGFNVGIGGAALYDSTTGSYLTAVGYEATSSSSVAVNNATALGANSIVGQSNSLILGQTADGKPGASYVNVGVGTATPRSTIELAVSAPDALGPVLTLTNSGKGESAIDFNTGLPAADEAYTPAVRILARDNGSGSSGVVFQSRVSGGLRSNLVVDNGGLHVTGALDAAANTVKIDHPLDPTNKYLVHASVESSEEMNIYTGNVVTDELGLATVKLPEWFEAENTDFRYQLTVVGRQAQAWIAEEVAKGQFKIAANATNTKVSWQITAVRQDAYAKANPLVVEEAKPASERGFYLHPEAFAKAGVTQAAAHLSHDQPASAVNLTFPQPAVPAMPPHPAPAEFKQFKPINFPQAKSIPSAQLK